jgi:RecA/RadA recombinase
MLINSLRCAEVDRGRRLRLVVLDNLAAMVTKKELENSAEIGDPGGSGRANMKLFNTIMASQKKAAEKGRAATFVLHEPDASQDRSVL